MSTDDRLQRWAREAMQDDLHSGPHLEDARLAQLAEGQGPATPEELGHLARCPECRDVLGAAAAGAAPPPGVIWWRRPAAWGAGVVLAAAAAVLLAVWAGPPRDSGYGIRGGPGSDAPSVTFLAVAPDGARRALAAGDEVPLDAQVGFQYGNPTGAAHSLTLLGWDGAEVHWYAPEAEGDRPEPIRGGADALSVPLPFRIRLADQHRAGPLTLYAAFDVDPAALAARLLSGAPAGPGVTAVPVRLVASAEEPTPP